MDYYYYYSLCDTLNQSKTENPILSWDRMASLSYSVQRTHIFIDLHVREAGGGESSPKHLRQLDAVVLLQGPHQTRY